MCGGQGGRQASGFIVGNGRPTPCQFFGTRGWNYTSADVLCILPKFTKSEVNVFCVRWCLRASPFKIRHMARPGH